ncbi:MAG: hypothetical protein HYR58_02505 [Acidobacteria bacterium]|nr:hypothetical protein [Acidobacteriota bacterium]
MLLAGLALASGAHAQDYKVETFDAAAPAELAPAIRETLGSAALRVIGPQGPLCEMWFRTAVPARATTQQKLGVAYGQFEEGTLFGAVRFLRENRDFRKQLVKPGVFTLRYALNPVDGNHMGVSPIRDFLLLLPAAEDVSPANITREDTIKLSKKSIGLNHPSVWSVTSGEGEHAKMPEVARLEEEDAWVLYFRLPVQPAGGAAAPLAMGLIIFGHAPEA